MNAIDACPLPGGFLPFSFPGLAGVRCLFSTALAGDMSRDGDGNPAASRENRLGLMRRAGFSHWAEVRQVHGVALIHASGNPEPAMDASVSADGQYTASRGVGLVIKTADCQPVLLARADGGAVAALHVGWRGNAANLPGLAVKRLCREFACEPRQLLAVRGPSLGPAAAEFVNFATEWPPEFAPWYDPDSRTMDLWALTRHQLRQAGLPDRNIFSLDFCTKTMRGLFFSHRNQDAGRHANAIWLEP